MRRLPWTMRLAQNTPSAMNDALSGTTTENKDVLKKASAPIHSNSDSGSNAIDESEWNFEKHAEQRI
jgi:hypothetical protein